MIPEGVPGKSCKEYGAEVEKLMSRHLKSSLL
jgi:hypothetical protein